MIYEGDGEKLLPTHCDTRLTIRANGEGVF